MSSWTLLVFLTSLLISVPALSSGQLPPAELMTAYYTPRQVILIDGFGFELVNLYIDWDEGEPKPTMYLAYHRAIPYLDRQLTLHFSLTIRHYPVSRAVKPTQACQTGEKRQIYHHRDLGDYLICSKDASSVSKVPGASREPLHHVLARMLPLPGNRAPHVLISLDTLPDELLPLAASLHSLDAQGF